MLKCKNDILRNFQTMCREEENRRNSLGMVGNTVCDLPNGIKHASLFVVLVFLGLPIHHGVV